MGEFTGSGLGFPQTAIEVGVTGNTPSSRNKETNEDMKRSRQVILDEGVATHASKVLRNEDKSDGIISPKLTSKERA